MTQVFVQIESCSASCTRSNSGHSHSKAEMNKNYEDLQWDTMKDYIFWIYYWLKNSTKIFDRFFLSSQLVRYHAFPSSGKFYQRSFAGSDYIDWVGSFSGHNFILAQLLENPFSQYARHFDQELLSMPNKIRRCSVLGIWQLLSRVCITMTRW